MKALPHAPTTEIGTTCSPCREAEHPLEHRACTGGDCQCRCRVARPLDLPRRPEPTDQHQPFRMLDISEVTVGCWVSWRRSEEAEGEGRGGVVVGIDRADDPETGETRRIFHTAKRGSGRIRWDTLPEEVVGDITAPDIATRRSLWRAMAAEIGRKRGTAYPEELRLGETIHLLQRSV